MTNLAFDNSRYLKAQIAAFKAKESIESGPTFIEFGGKPFGDHHAARVLPGYDPDIKAKILKELSLNAKIVMAVNARDILSPPTGRCLKKRIRGDSGLWYDQEVVRLISESRLMFGFKIDTVVITVTPKKLTPLAKKELLQFKQDLKDIDVEAINHYEIPEYPNIKCIEAAYKVFKSNPRISHGENLVVFSPGGGSGKFNVILSEVYHALKHKLPPNFIKFETFPAFNLDSNHPLNLAFEVATADLKNKVKNTKDGTNYDKDIQNFKMMSAMVSQLDGNSPLAKMKSPLDWGVNQIEQGITDMSLVKIACHDEIVRRIARYEEENKNGIEKLTTIQRAKKILEEFETLTNSLNL